MIYQIDDKYYVNISPSIYVEIELRLQDDDLILVPTDKQREVSKTYQIKSIFFEQEKEKLKARLKADLEKKEKKKEEEKIINKPINKNISFKKNRRK